MKIKKLFVISLVIGLIFFGILISKDLSSSEPPTPNIMTENGKVKITQGSYCWSGLFSGKCVDKIYDSPLAMTKGHKPIEVSRNSKIKIQFKKEPLKGSLSVEQWTNEKDVKKIVVKNDTITVPNESGLYIYHIVANWEQGDGNFAFIIKVK